MAKNAKDVRLVLHIGLHKTATTYVQNLLSAQRYDLLREGVLYPTAGTVDRVPLSTRDGAQSGQTLFTRGGDRKALVADLLAELPDATSTVLISAEDFSLPRSEPSPAALLDRFGAFGEIAVVLVLRRQDKWVESVYKQIVDQFHNQETRSFGDYLEQVGPTLLDFHTRFSPWRDLVGAENFHAISYDDVDGGAGIHRRLLEIAGVPASSVGSHDAADVPRYESVRAIDTLGLRILNGYRLTDRDVRTRAAQSIYAAAPTGDITLMTPEMRDAVQTMCAPVNERIEAQWFDQPVPGLRFGKEVRRDEPMPPSPQELLDYFDRVVAVCDQARTECKDGSGE